MPNLLTGPVAVTGASSHVGDFLQRRLAELTNEVRPLGREDDLRAAFRDADAAIHLAGTLQPVKGNTYEAANVETMRSTIEALAGSPVKRLVFLSYIGADPRSSNDYLRTKGEAEALVRTCGREAVILRASFIFGPPDEPGRSMAPFIARGSKPVSVIGDGTQRYAPVFVGDVVEALVHAALDPSAPTGTFALGGPDVFTVDELVERLNRGPVKKRHLDARLLRVAARVIPALTPALVEVMSADSLPDSPLANDAFRLETRSIEDVYRGAVPA